MTPASRNECGIEPARRRPTDLLDRELIRDTRLSFRALGIAVRLLSNSPGYRMDSLALAAEGAGREGRDAIRAALRELEDVGYLIRERIRLPSGQWVTHAVISDRQLSSVPLPPKPDFQASASTPMPENPAPGKPTVGGIGDKSRKSSRLSNRKATTTAIAVAMDVDDLIWPAAIKPEERVVVVRQFFVRLMAADAQNVLDELEGRIQLNRPPQATMAWLKGAAEAAKRGEFVLDAGRAVQAARARAAAEAEQKRLQVSATIARHDPDARARADAAARRAAAAAAEIGIFPRSYQQERRK